MFLPAREFTLEGFARAEYRSFIYALRSKRDYRNRGKND
jgi:hypothetical protein